MVGKKSKHEKPFHEPGWQSLANAIVEMAAKDLMNIFEYYKNNPDRELKVRSRDEFKFFYSEWCKMLTDIDGDAIVRGIRKRVWEE